MESEKQMNLILPLGSSNQQGKALNEGLQRKAAEDNLRAWIRRRLIRNYFTGRMSPRCIENTSDARGCQSRPFRIAHGTLRGETPCCVVIIPTDEFQAPLHRLPGEHGLVSLTKLDGQMNW